jgi:hypothetical protein
MPSTKFLGNLCLTEAVPGYITVPETFPSDTGVKQFIFGSVSNKVIHRAEKISLVVID